MTRRWIAATMLAVTATVAAQPAANVDGARVAWQYRRDVALPAGRPGGFAAIPVPPEVASRSQADLRDLRLVDASGRETPFVVLDDTARTAERRTTGRLVAAQQERRDRSVWTADFGEPIAFDRLVLDVTGQDFSKRVRLELSLDGTTWLEAGLDHWLFERQWQQQVIRGTTIETPQATARLVRVTADDTRSRPIAVTGIRAESSTRLSGSRWSQDVTLELLTTSAGRSRYRVAVPTGFPVRRVAIDADDAAFARMVYVVEQRDGVDRVIERWLAYRFRLPEATQDVASSEVDVTGASGAALLIDVIDGDNPPLVNPRVRLSAPQTLLVTATTASTLRLYYGNSVTRAAAYDLERLRSALAAVAAYPTGTLGGEIANPRYQAPAPLAFAPSRGAVIDPAAWKYARTLRVSGDDDLYTLAVPAADLAHLRRDFADLRLVDAANLQVPYVVEGTADITRVPLTIASAMSRPGMTQTSAYRLSVPPATSAEALTFTSLDLAIAEGFFSREATVLVAQADAPQGQRVVATRTIASARREAVTAPVTATLEFGSVTATSLILEVRNGDNAPLTIRGAFGVAPVPRMTFKAGAGEYRLLLGNAQAAAPTYELEALRQEVLAYSALPLGGDALQPVVANPDYARDVSDVLREAPPAAVLWGALGVAVVVLLALTQRILKKGAPDPRGPHH